MPALEFIVPAITSVTNSSIGAHAASSAANQQKAAGQAAAQTFQPFVGPGVAAFNEMASKYGIPPAGVGNVQQAMQGILSPVPQQSQTGGLIGSIIRQQQLASQPVVPLPVTQPIVDEGQPLGNYGVKGGSSYAG